MSTLTKHSEALYCLFCLSATIFSSLSIKITELWGHSCTLTHTTIHTHTRTFAVASLTQCQCSVPLVSVLQTHLHIKKGIYPGKHSMCLYKTGGCLLFMCELVIGLGGGWSHCSVHWPPSKDVPIHSNLAPSITAPACSKIQLSSTN